MPWTPASLFQAGDTGGWFDFSDVSTLFQNSAGSTPVTADNQPIGRINSKFGAGANAFNLTQATTSAKPTYRTDGTLHWAEFDGADWLDSGVSRFGKSGLFAAASENYTMAVMCHVGVNTGTLIGRAGATSNTKTLQLYYTSTDDLRLISRGGVASGHPLPATGPAFIANRWNGSANDLRYNDSTTSAAVGTATEETTQRIIVGGRTNGTGFYLGNTAKVYQLFFIDRALTDNELGYLAKYLGVKGARSGIGLDPPESGIALAAATIAPSASTTSAAVIAHAIPSAVSVAAPLAVITSPLSQHHALSVANVAANAAFAAPATTATHAISASTASASASVAAAAITQRHALSAATIAAAATVVAPPLASGLALGAVTVAPDATSVALSLEQHHALASTAAAAGADITSPALTTHASLAEINWAMSGSVSAASMAQHHALGVATAEAAATFSSPDLSPGSSLGSSTAAPSAAITAPALTQHHALIAVIVAPVCATVAPSIGSSPAIALWPADAYPSPIFTVAALPKYSRFHSRSRSSRWHSISQYIALKSQSRTARLTSKGIKNA